MESAPCARSRPAAAGDGVLLPKGWTGVWDSAGYRKIYVIYDCKKTQ